MAALVQFCCCLFAGLLLATSAVAQDDAGPPDPQAEAKALFELGRMAYAAADYWGALRYWEQSHHKSGHPKLKYNIGLAHEGLGQDEEALAAYRAYIKWERDGPRSDDVRGKIVRLEEATAEPEPVAQAPAPRPTQPDPPPVRAPQRAAQPRQPVTAQPIAHTGVDVLPVALMVGGGTLLIAGTVTGLLALRADTLLDRLCGTDRACRDDQLPSRNALVSDIDKFSLATDILLPLGLLVSGLGIYLWLNGDDDAPQVACSADGCHGRMHWNF